MPDLLLELFSEEIPARMQRRAAEDLKTLVTGALVERGLLYEGAKAFATPRRLALHIAGLPAKGADQREEKKGPRVGAPEAAVQGFLKSAGLADISRARIEKDPKKGEFYVAVIEKPGRATTEVVAEVMPAIIRAFPWPKSMRWGAASREPGSLTWVRPLHAILCTFGPETEEPEVVHFSVGGIEAGALTRGHRFHAPEPIKVRRFDDYVARLEKAKVVLDADRRKAMILADAKTLAFAQGLELVEDEALLEEVAGLVEWPVVLMGGFDESFLDIPAEVIRATIRANQKCFVLKGATPPPPSPRERGEGKGEGRRDISGEGDSSGEAGAAPHPNPLPANAGRGGELAPRFLLVANIEAKDGGKAIVAGNERVIRARLSDALHFWKTDRGNLPNVADYTDAAKRLGLDLKKPLDQRMAKLAHLDVVFHEKLGTQGERVERIVALARELAPIVGADPNLVARAAALAKADLTSEVVGEFPETQGLMGRRYAALQGEHPSVCAAIEEHYKPQGPGDRVPTDPVSIAVALADKLDTLVGFWAIDEKPTGSKDPYALRRAALGVINAVAGDGRRTIMILPILQSAAAPVVEQMLDRQLKLMRENEARLLAEFEHARRLPFALGPQRGAVAEGFLIQQRNEIEQFELSRSETQRQMIEAASTDLLSFFHDRLKVQLREQGARHDLVDAVLAGGATSPSPRSSRGEGRGEGQRDGSKLAPPPAASRSPSSGPSGHLLPASGGEKEAANDDLLLVVRRVEALGRFLDAEDGKNLLAGYRRAANILRAEEKKDGEGAFEGAVDPALLAGPEEKALAAALDAASENAAARVAAEDFEGAMRTLADLRPAVDSFFDKVMVNADDKALRANRLKLLSGLRRATRTVADFGKIGG